MDFGFLFTDMLQQGLIWAIMALGVFIAYRVEDIADLGAEGAFPLGAAVAVMALNAGITPVLAVVLAILAGALTGLFTSLLHTLLKIPSLLAGIITMVGLYSIILRVLGRANVPITSGTSTVFTPLQDLLGNRYLGIVATMGLIVIALFFLLYWFFGTEIGVALRATGKNKAMAKAQSINTNVMIVLGLVISNALIAMSGAFYAQQSHYADVGMGRGTIVVGLAAIFLGEAVFGKRSFKNTLISVILGGFVYFLIIDIALELNMNPNDLKLLQAIIIILMIAWPLFKKWLSKPYFAVLNWLKKCFHRRPRKAAV